MCIRDRRRVHGALENEFLIKELIHSSGQHSHATFLFQPEPADTFDAPSLLKVLFLQHIVRLPCDEPLTILHNTPEILKDLEELDSLSERKTIEITFVYFNLIRKEPTGEHFPGKDALSSAFLRGFGNVVDQSTFNRSDSLQRLHESKGSFVHHHSLFADIILLLPHLMTLDEQETFRAKQSFIKVIWNTQGENHAEEIIPLLMQQSFEEKTHPVVLIVISPIYTDFCRINLMFNGITSKGIPKQVNPNSFFTGPILNGMTVPIAIAPLLLRLTVLNIYREASKYFPFDGSPPNESTSRSKFILHRIVDPNRTTHGELLTQLLDLRREKTAKSSKQQLD
eukprot:TRINITY_DN9619_c0_g1_i1.p1 TRINITY_DN9619_c0_g1~~TRINITY_DN9619_c0_g1_i1.p1  ORF type:complete len:359 (-),score=90.73 TRINITY_DN9619_c0_g1_i1:107-1123(-)